MYGFKVKGSEKMLSRAVEKDRRAILDYLKDEPSINLFMIGDIERFGFDSEFQEVWYQGSQEDISGVVLRYHDNFILYTKTVLDTKELLSLLTKYKVGVISGKAKVVDPFYSLVQSDYTYLAMNFAELRKPECLSTATSDVEVASLMDTQEIATMYGQIKEFEHLYSSDVKERRLQIENRITSGEGKHLMIRKEGKIVSHANTAAETQSSAMIGGVMTLASHRRCGFAKQLISKIGHDLIMQKKTACLFYSGLGPEKLIKNLGFEDIDKWIVLGGKNE
jgi:predicted GNAT family acetyltransferase